MKRFAHLPGLLVAVLGIAFVTRELIDNWDDVVAAVRDAGALPLAAALVLAVIGMAWIGGMWRRILAAFGVERPLLETVARYFLGQLGKYVPGGIWPVIGQAEMVRRTGVDGSAAYGTTMLSHIAAYLACASVATVALLLGGAPRGAVAWWPVLLLLPAGLAALHPTILTWGTGLLERLSGRELGLTVPSWSTSVGLLVLHTPVWLLVGAATWVLAADLDPGTPSVLNILLATTLSWFVGLIAIGVPGGIGVREAVFVATATTLDSSGVAAAVAVTARLVFIVADVTGAAGATLLAGGREVVNGPRSS